VTEAVGGRFRPRKTISAGRWGVLAWIIAAGVPIAFLLLFFAWPVVALVATGVGGGGISGSAEPLGIWEVLRDPAIARAIIQTLAQSSAGTALALILGLPAAYVLYRLSFRGRAVLRALATVPFVLPTVVVGVAFTSLLGPSGPLGFLGLDQSFLIIVLALAFFNVTVVMRTVGGFWAALDPRPEQAARTLGAGPVRVWFTVTLRSLAPAIASAAALVFLFCATSFGIVIVLGGRHFSTIETEIYRLTMQFLDLRSSAVLALAQFVVVAAVMVVSTRLRGRREASAGYGGQNLSARAPRLGGAVRRSMWHWIAILGFALTSLLLHVLPLAALVWRSFRAPGGGLTLAHYRHLLHPPEGSALQGSVLDAIGLSFGFAAIATAIALVLGALVSLVLSRRPRQRWLRRGIAIYDGFIMLPLGVSAVTLGFGLLLTMHRPLGIGIDLRTSLVLIPIAQALVALPLVVRTLLPSLRAIDPRLRDAAATLGASPLRVLGTIDFPMLGRQLGLAVGFAAAAALAEFGATAFLVRPGAQTLPVAIGQLVNRQGVENYGMALSASVVLGVLVAGIMMLAERWRGQGVSEF